DYLRVRFGCTTGCSERKFVSGVGQERPGQEASSQPGTLLRGQREQETLGLESQRRENARRHRRGLRDRRTEWRKPASEWQAALICIPARRSEPSLTLASLSNCPEFQTKKD